MRADPRKLLFDVATACNTAATYSRGHSLADYRKNVLLRSACERQLEIVGEAMTRLRERHPDTFARIPEGHAIIAFRNRLIHGYDSVDSDIVWDVIQGKLPELERIAKLLLEEAG
jgi:uncharacterized protein with HEPN domain